MKLVAEEVPARKTEFLTSWGRCACGFCVSSKMTIPKSITCELGEACASLQPGANLFSSAAGCIKQSRDGANRATEKASRIRHYLDFKYSWRWGCACHRCILHICMSLAGLLIPGPCAAWLGTGGV